MTKREQAAIAPAVKPFLHIKIPLVAYLDCQLPQFRLPVTGAAT